MNICKFIIAITLLSLTSAVHAEKKKPKEVYIPMDYSTCGYQASEKNIPNVKNIVFVNATSSDNYERIQKAIDFVSKQKVDANGHRGAVLLGKGTFNISKSLRINTSGVVLRGTDKEQTILNKTGYDRDALIYIEGRRSIKTKDTISINESIVKAGATSFTLATTKGLKIGMRIQIVRPCTSNWIETLKCYDFGGGLDYTGWKPTDMEITWDRTITAINGTKIVIDAPITTTLDKQYGGGKIITGYNEGEITECGVENLTITTSHNAWNPKDEDHCWNGIWADNARDCWVRRIKFETLAGSAVTLQKNTSRFTIEDCLSENPISEIGGWRRCTFLTRGQQTLIQRCISRHGIHDFAAGYCAAGPNAFVQCEGEESLGFSGSIGSWAAGLLFDIVNIDGNDIKYANLDQFQFGTGWNTANSMMWQCTGSTLYCYTPEDGETNSAHGCWGTLTGDGWWTSSNDHVKPRSLFYNQLEKRMGKDAINGYILPRNLEASSSPSVEQAQIMAHISLTEPRLTMEMWQDSIPYTADISANTIKNIDKIKANNNKTDKQTNTFAITNGHITANGLLIAGGRYEIPWWSGRVKDNFVKQAKPAITRFVPGREGTAWTDRIDSVVSYLSNNKYCLLNHHYGLWYDLRRTDHERIRRADGDVWAPFYELPFSRSGKGTAWDGLSQYDLTKYNMYYWSRLKEFAEAGAQKGILLFHENYFQHNILEAGAHWVDSPWRPVNNINGTNFPEPVPFTGDKRIFVAEQFYDITNPILRPLHEKYIRQCLDNFKEDDNVIQLISAEYTGPLHFTRFWLQTISQWEKETGKHPLIALSCTKDVQDAILSDSELSKVVDIIDIRFWHYNTEGLWAPEGGKNMAPRQFMRRMKVGKTGFNEAYKAVREYREKYPDKAVTFFAQQYPQYGWAILMAGGSCPNIPVNDKQFLKDVVSMNVLNAEGCIAIGNNNCGYVIYPNGDSAKSINVANGKYRVSTIDPINGDVETAVKSTTINGTYNISNQYANKIVWLQKL